MRRRCVLTSAKEFMRPVRPELRSNPPVASRLDFTPRQRPDDPRCCLTSSLGPDEPLRQILHDAIGSYINSPPTVTNLTKQGRFHMTNSY